MPLHNGKNCSNGVQSAPLDNKSASTVHIRTTNLASPQASGFSPLHTFQPFSHHVVLHHIFWNILCNLEQNLPTQGGKWRWKLFQYKYLLVLCSYSWLSLIFSFDSNLCSQISSANVHIHCRPSHWHCHSVLLNPDSQSWGDLTWFLFSSPATSLARPHHQAGWLPVRLAVMMRLSQTNWLK